MNIYKLFYEKLPWHIITIINSYYGDNELSINSEEVALNKNDIIFYFNIKNVKINFELYNKNFELYNKNFESYNLLYNNKKFKFSSTTIFLNKSKIKGIKLFDRNYLKLDIASDTAQVLNFELLKLRLDLDKQNYFDKYKIFFDKLKKLDNNIYKNIINSNEFNKYLIKENYKFEPIIKIQDDIGYCSDTSRNFMFGILYYIKVYFNNTNYWEYKNKLLSLENFENFSSKDRITKLILEPRMIINHLEKKIHINLYCESIYYF